MRRLLVAIILLLAVAALYWRFPYALDDENTLQRLLYLVLLLLIIVLGAGRIKREMMPKLLRNGVIWVAVMLLLVLGYSFRDGLSRRLVGELMPQQVQQNADGSIEVRASEGGHFFIEAKVNETHVRFMVDTGASDIVLSPRDAERAGLHPEVLSYDRSYSTANGYGSGAEVTLDTLAVGSFSLSRLSASVNKADMSHSLLGMSFLKRLRSFRVEDNTLVLIP
jgi:aspartyl protease family protein